MAHTPERPRLSDRFRLFVRGCLAAALPVLFGVLVGACTSSPNESEEDPTAPAPGPGAAATEARVEETAPPPAADDGGVRPARPPRTPGKSAATLGEPAPDFTLPDHTGKRVHLAEQRGNVVVLEWFNPECPFVARCHEKGSLAEFPNRCVAEGIVWLAINSSAPGEQGSELARNLEQRERWNLLGPILFDETGEVGRAYGAASTPHMFVIDERGVLIYQGAIDNDPSGERLDSERINYVQSAIAGRKSGVTTPSTKPYGCSVKYAN